RLLCLLVEGWLRIDETLASQRHVLLNELVAAVGARQDHVAGRNALRLGLGCRHRRMDQVERQPRSTRNDVLETRRILEAWYLNEYPVVALALDRGFGRAQLVDAVADHFDRLGDERRHALVHAIGRETDDDLAVRRIGEGQLF